MDKLIFFGTGHAMTYRHLYNTSFSLTDGKSHFLTDGGGGNTILRQLELAQVDVNTIDHIFLSHLHTDHILGAIWLARVAGQNLGRASRTTPLTFYGHESVLQGFRTMCEVILQTGLLHYFDKEIRFQAVEDKETLHILGREVNFFDTGAKKRLQFGYRVRLRDGSHLTFCGDEPLREEGRPYAQKADHLIHEAMCLTDQESLYHPHRISHSTVRDAAETAEELGVKHLILFHTEDDQVDTRKALYEADAKNYFSGRVSVPNDLESIILTQ